jgi:hypothetical protein
VGNYLKPEKHITKKKREFDTTFKLEVARMVRDQGMSVSDVCRTRKIVIGMRVSVVWNAVMIPI